MSDVANRTGEGGLRSRRVGEEVGEEVEVGGGVEEGGMRVLVVPESTVVVELGVIVPGSAEEPFRSGVGARSAVVVLRMPSARVN